MSRRRVLDRCRSTLSRTRPVLLAIGGRLTSVLFPAQLLARPAAGYASDESALDRGDELRTELGCADHRVDRAHLDSPLDAVDAVELRCDLTELLGSDLGTQLGQVGDQGSALCAVRVGHARLQIGDTRVGGGARVNLAGEDD